MDFISNFVNPVSVELRSFASTLPMGTIGSQIMFFDENVSTIAAQSVLVFTIPEYRNTLYSEYTTNGFYRFRKEWYTLYSGNWFQPIYDLGDVEIGHTFEETLSIVKEIIHYCVQHKFIPILIGGSQALTYSMYRAFDRLEQTVNLTVADARFDLNHTIGNRVHAESYLYHIIMDKPNNLNNFTNLGYQTFLNPQEEIQLINTLLFDAHRLGVLKKDMELCEPVLRETDVLSIDFGSLKSSDIVGHLTSKISGFSSDEMCQLTRYAGLSSKIKMLGVFEYNPYPEYENSHAQVLAQMIWYFMDGLNYRKDEFPNPDLVGFKKYMVMIEQETLTFYKSEATERWWMEINVLEDNKIKRRTLIPCTYNDYVTANRMEYPERWLTNKRKLEI